ncbi:Zinc finger, C2H2 type family protein [Brugia malayi]|uniref:Bm10606 n=1 Tax=Brugia malayi TaxID=6279 RepID=A0A0K0INU6_BRUMA|nr:Zinc finger, C2H2 type family protein [Brugia malayi]CTP81494.1 Bm10606 [Brugia malayi]VIO98078.1 Zinc finger, C2H2 type family protein [Brugia malayi]
MANPSASIQSTFDISKFTRPISELLFSTTDNRIQPLLPLFSLPFPNQYPINLITNDITFSRGLCPICGRIYGSFKDFQDHMMAHHERKYECEKCARTFVSEKRMRAHELKKHSAHISNTVKENNGERKLFECNQCDRTYETFYNFKEHLAKHKGKLFRCTICNKHLSGQSALSRHAKIHEKPHECMMCTSRFSSAYDLDCHFSYYHSTIKRFKCFHCNRVLYNYSGKLRHERLCSLKNTIIRKVPHSQIVNLPKIISSKEKLIQTKLKHEEVEELGDNKKCQIISNHSAAINLINEAKFHKPKTVAFENSKKLTETTKFEQKKTFHICDIMHDMPGFS